MALDQVQECTLSTTRWAKYLTPGEFSALRSEYSTRVLKKGAYLFHQGDKFNFWTGIVDGFAKISSVSSDGKEVTFSSLGRGRWFGGGSLLNDEHRKYDVIAIQDTSFGMLARSAFVRLSKISLGFNRYLVCQMNERIGLLSERIEALNFLQPHVRVARSIYRLLSSYEDSVIDTTIEISQDEIGLLTDLSRQGTNSGIQTLKQRRLIDWDRNTLKVLDCEKLRALCRFGGMTNTKQR